MTATNAWELSLTGGLRAAVGERQLIHLIDSPTLYPVPCTPGHCSRIGHWRDIILPVIDLTHWLNSQSRRPEPLLLGVVAYASGPQAPTEYGALPLAKPPKRIGIDDVQACRLPAGKQAWRAFALACFKDAGGHPVPILDLPRIYARGLLAL